MEARADKAALGRGQDLGAAIGLSLHIGAAHRRAPVLQCGK
jgi:hypothetical protein